MLRVVIDELEGASLVSLRIDYDPAARPAEVLEPTPDPFWARASGGPTSPEESEVWRLALQAAASSDRADRPLRRP